jgi:hypothetical protein
MVSLEGLKTTDKLNRKGQNASNGLLSHFMVNLTISSGIDSLIYWCYKYQSAAN